MNQRLITLVLAFITISTFCCMVAYGQRPISFGETIVDTISVVGEVDTYTFTANEGDAILIRMAQTSLPAEFQPNIELLAPGGSSLSTDVGSNVAEIRIMPPDGTLGASGTYTILASGQGNRTATYTLHLQRTNDPGNAKTIENRNRPRTLRYGSETRILLFKTD